MVRNVPADFTDSNNKNIKLTSYQSNHVLQYSIWRFVKTDMRYEVCVMVTIMTEIFGHFHGTDLQHQFRHVHKITRSDCQLCHVCPRGTIWLPLDKFSRNLVLNFREFVEQISVSLKLTRITGTIHEDRYALMIIFH